MTKYLLILLLTINTYAFQKRKIHTISVNGKSDGKWTSFAKDPELNVKNLLQKLAISSVGRELIKSAAKKAAEDGLDIYDVIKPGSGSLTDTTLIRRFSVSDPNAISYETKSVVYINEEHSTFDALLDLAHELTHYVYRESFNPYSLNFTLEEFIKSTIEGHGGEAHAFVTECRILKDLYPSHLKRRKNCQEIYQEDSGEFSVANASKQFYRLGHQYQTFLSKISKHNLDSKFPHASNRSISFISSAYGLPYPIAAFEEYTTVLKRVCQNDKKRLVYLLKENSGRSPASEVVRAEKSYFEKCKDS